jgi:hypothetical protein
MEGVKNVAEPRGGRLLSHRHTKTYSPIQLDAILQSYNLLATVHFPTRVQNQSNMAIGNIFIDIHKIINYTVSPIYNGL